MKLSKIEKEILARALKNQTIECREFPHWRAAVKAPLPAPPQEIAGEPMPLEMYESAHGNLQPAAFMQQVQALFARDIIPSRTNGIAPDTFQKIGFVFAAGAVCWSRVEAEKIVEEWKKKAPWLDYFILPELEPFCDLFVSELAGGMPGVAHKARPMTISPDADTKAVERFNKAALNLEKKGFVCRVSGQDMTRPWSGVNITKAGKVAIEEIEAAERAPATPEPDGPKLKLKCMSCSGAYHQMTEKFDPDAPPTGEMFTLLPKYKTQGWDQWPVDWTGENLICPECGERYPDPNTGLLRLGAIIEVTENIAA